MTTLALDRDVLLLHRSRPGYWCRALPGKPVPQPDLLTLTQVAERLQVSHWTVYQLIWNKELHSVHLGRCHRVRVRDIDAYLDSLDPDGARP